MEARDTVLVLISSVLVAGAAADGRAVTVAEVRRCRRNPGNGPADSPGQRVVDRDHGHDRHRFLGRSICTGSTSTIPPASRRRRRTATPPVSPAASSSSTRPSPSSIRTASGSTSTTISVQCGRRPPPGETMPSQPTTAGFYYLAIADDDVTALSDFSVDGPIFPEVGVPSHGCRGPRQDRGAATRSRSGSGKTPFPDPRTYSIALTGVVVPEPASAALLALGLIAWPNFASPGFLDTRLIVFSFTPPRPASRGRAGPGRDSGSRTSPTSTARCRCA